MDLKCVTISKEISNSTICIQSESRGHWFMVENSTISFNKSSSKKKTITRDLIFIQTIPTADSKPAKLAHIFLYYNINGSN